MRRVSRVAAALVLSLAACDSARPCPPCECECKCDGDNAAAADPGVPATPSDASTQAGDLGELVASANRKLAHGDGPGCLADLDRVKAIDPKLDTQLRLVRAQCQMAAGECQAGKQVIVDYYVRELAMTPERAETTAESMASMRCKGGDATERDQLLVAYFDLTDGAYMNKRDVEFCRSKIATITSLAAKVPPRDSEDTQISGGRQALFFTGAMCFARAGDCDAAYAHYHQFFPAEGLDALTQSQRETAIHDAYASSIELCATPAP